MARLVVTAVLAALVAAPAAWAQSASNRGGPAAGLRAEGENGIALSDDGRSRLHLGIDAGAGFDTNPYSEPVGDATFSGDLTARIRPYVEVNNPGALLAFKGRASLDYGFLPGVVDENTRSFLLYQLNAGGDLEVNRGGMFNFAVGDSVSWNSDPGIVVVGSLLNRVNNQLRAGVGMTPGGGTLQLRLGYAFDFTKYFDVDGINNNGLIEAGAFDTMRHSVTLRTDYRFLPKTGVFTSVGIGWQSYPFDASLDQPDAFPFTALVGVQGNLLPKLAGLASIGYSNPFVVDETGLVTGRVVGVVGQLEAQWAPTPQTNIAGGFQRRFDPIALYQFVGNNRFYGRVQQNLLGRFAFGLNAGYSLLEFGTEEAGGQQLTDQPVGRIDGNLDAGVNVAYFFYDWMSVGISNNTDWRHTNAEDISNPANPVNLGYVRNVTLVMLSLRY